MEAKGCARPVQRKNARRHFFWALRSQLSLSTAISKLTAISPRLSTEEAKRRIFDQIPQVSHTDDRAVAEALESLDLSDVVAQVTSAHVTGEIMSLVQSHRKAGLAGLVGVVNALTDEEKAALAVALQGVAPSPGRISIRSSMISTLTNYSPSILLRALMAGPIRLLRIISCFISKYGLLVATSSISLSPVATELLP
ncbi:5609_t:CDS:1, partial [Acaulospora colombiana]